MKRSVVYKLVFILALLCSMAQGQQFTSVSATITDPSSQVWSNAIITANLIPAFQKPGPSLNQGHAITDSLQFLQANGSGTFSLTVDDNTFVTPSGSQWAFTICSNTSAQCTTVTLTISGASQNISGAINAAISNLVVNAVPTILRAYNGVEATGGNGAIYWRTTDNTFWGCNALPNQYCSLGGGTWVEIGTGGGVPSYLPCQTGIGDGANIIPAATYHQVFCKNDSTGSITIHGISCYTDSNDSSTLNATDQANTALLTGAITCTNSTYAAGTISGTPTIPKGGYIKFTFVAGGTSTQTSWAVY